MRRAASTFGHRNLRETSRSSRRIAKRRSRGFRRKTALAVLWLLSGFAGDDGFQNHPLFGSCQRKEPPSLSRSTPGFFPIEDCGWVCWNPLWPQRRVAAVGWLRSKSYISQLLAAATGRQSLGVQEPPKFSADGIPSVTLVLYRYLL